MENTNKRTEAIISEVKAEELPNLIKRSALLYENVHVEVRDELWHGYNKYIYSCLVLNPSDLLPMRGENYIALHSDRYLPMKIQVAITIEKIEESKYSATYSIVEISNDSLISSGASSFNVNSDYENEGYEESVDYIMECEAEDLGLSVDEYLDYIESGYDTTDYDH